MPSDSQLLSLHARIAPAAVSAARLTGVPAEFICAQCILESGWLEHAPGNNCFGIKSYQGEQGRQLLRTREWFTEAEFQHFLSLHDGRVGARVANAPADARGRHLYEVQDWFATFATLSDCFKKRALLFTSPVYDRFVRAYREHPDLEAFVRGVSKIWATDPEYAEKVLELARSPEVTEIVDKLWASLNSFEDAERLKTV